MNNLKPNSINQNSINYRNSCLGVVLAGGLSSRMGEDKSALIRNNINMLNYSKQLLTDAGITQVIVSGKHQDITSSNNTVTDLVKNAGPVGGIFSVIEQYRPLALLVLPVDLPLMDSASLAKLKLVGELSQKACFYQDNYLPLYLPVNAFVEQFLQNKFSQTNNRGPSIRALLAQVPHQELIPENPNSLFNANTPEQWQQVKSNAFKLTPFQARKSYV